MAVLGPEKLLSIAQELQLHHTRLIGVKNTKSVDSRKLLDDLCLLSELQAKIYYGLKSTDELPYICWPSIDEILKLLERHFNDNNFAEYCTETLLPVFKEETSLRTKIANSVLRHFIGSGNGTLDSKGAKKPDLELFKKALNNIHGLTPDTLQQSGKPITVLTDIFVNHLFLGKRSIQTVLISAKKSAQSGDKPLDVKYLKDLESANEICRSPRFDTIEFNLGPSVIFSGRQMSKSVPNTPTAKGVDCNKLTQSAPTTPSKKGGGSQLSTGVDDTSNFVADFAELALEGASASPLVPSLRKQFEEQGFIDGPTTGQGEKNTSRPKSPYRF